MAKRAAVEQARTKTGVSELPGVSAGGSLAGDGSQSPDTAPSPGDSGPDRKLARLRQPGWIRKRGEDHHLPFYHVQRVRGYVILTQTSNDQARWLQPSVPAITSRVPLRNRPPKVEQFHLASAARSRAR